MLGIELNLSTKGNHFGNWTKFFNKTHLIHFLLHFFWWRQRWVQLWHVTNFIVWVTTSWKTLWRQQRVIQISALPKLKLITKIYHHLSYEHARLKYHVLAYRAFDLIYLRIDTECSKYYIIHNGCNFKQKMIITMRH